MPSDEIENSRNLLREHNRRNPIHSNKSVGISLVSKYLNNLSALNLQTDALDLNEIEKIVMEYSFPKQWEDNRVFTGLKLRDDANDYYSLEIVEGSLVLPVVHVKQYKEGSSFKVSEFFTLDAKRAVNKAYKIYNKQTNIIQNGLVFVDFLVPKENQSVRDEKTDTRSEGSVIGFIVNSYDIYDEEFTPQLIEKLSKNP